MRYERRKQGLLGISFEQQLDSVTHIPRLEHQPDRPKCAVFAHEIEPVAGRDDRGSISTGSALRIVHLGKPGGARIVGELVGVLRKQLVRIATRSPTGEIDGALAIGQSQHIEAIVVGGALGHIPGKLPNYGITIVRTRIGCSRYLRRGLREWKRDQRRCQQQHRAGDPRRAFRSGSNCHQMPPKVPATSIRRTTNQQGEPWLHVALSFRETLLTGITLRRQSRRRRSPPPRRRRHSGCRAPARFPRAHSPASRPRPRYSIPLAAGSWRLQC